MSADYAIVKALARKLAGFCGQDPEAVIRGDTLRAEMAMRLRDGCRQRGLAQGANLNELRAYMNFIPSAEAMLARDPAILSRIAAGYVPPMRGGVTGGRA